MYQFKHVIPSIEDWKRIEESKDSVCYTSEQWCKYLAAIHYSVYVIKVCKDGKMLGYFIGERIWRGFWILAAPWDGIGTYTQGLVMMTPISEEMRISIYQQLAEWVFANKIAVMMQVDDWQLRRDSVEWIPYEVFKQETLERLGMPYSVRPTLYLPIAGKSEEELWAGLHYKSCKYSINKANKLGLYVRRITDKNEIKRFAQYHHKQLVEVCAKQGMRPKPSQSQKRMQMLCESLFPDRVIMLECRGKDENGVEQIMSTGIFCIDKGECIYWTGASFQRYQKYCPNELMVWEAIKIIREMGGGVLNYGGMASYKLKFGTIYTYVPRIVFTKYKWTYQLKLFAKNTFFNVRKAIAHIVGRHSFK